MLRGQTKPRASRHSVRMNYLNRVAPKWRLRARRKSELSAENVEAVLVRHSTVLLQSWRSLSRGM